MPFQQFIAPPPRHRRPSSMSVMDVTLGDEIKAFGRRVFDLTPPVGGETSSAVPRAAAGASRAYLRALGEGDARLARRSLELTFKGLTDTVRALDGLPVASTSVLASALAAEGSLLCEAVYDLLPSE